MLAVIKTGGKQYKVSPGDKIRIEKLDARENENVVFNEVLLAEKGKSTKIGIPLVSGAKVEGRVIEQGKADKVVVFKYKPKKRYKVKKGHRQLYSLIKIEKISI